MTWTDCPFTSLVTDFSSLRSLPASASYHVLVSTSNDQNGRYTPRMGPADAICERSPGANQSDVTHFWKSSPDFAFSILKGTTSSGRTSFASAADSVAAGCSVTFSLPQ